MHGGCRRRFRPVYEVTFVIFLKNLENVIKKCQLFLVCFVKCTLEWLPNSLSESRVRYDEVLAIKDPVATISIFNVSVSTFDY